MKYLIYIITFIILLSSVFSLQLNETNIHATVVKDITSNYCLKVTNPDNRTHYNISMTNFPHTKINLDYNQSGNLCYNITRPDVGEMVFSPIVFGYYKILSVADRTNYKINLIDLRNYTVRINDRIELCNNYGIPHLVKESSNSWQYTLNPLECKNITEISYTQEIIDVTNSNRVGYFLFVTNIVESYGRDVSQDTSFNLQISTTYPNSKFHIIKLIDSYISPYNEDTVGIVQIKNDENAVMGARLSIDWGYFDTPVLNFATNETKFAQFRIRPNITYNEQTNKTYQLNIKVTVDGFKESNDTISVFVPYYDIVPQNYTGNRTIYIIREMTVDEKIAFLQSEQGLGVIRWYCFESSPNGTREECLRTEKVYLNADLNETLTKLIMSVDYGFDRCLNSITTMKTEDLVRIFNNTDQLQQICQNVTAKVEKPLSYVVNEDKKRKEETKWRNIGILIGILCLVILVVIIQVLRKAYAKKKELMQHGNYVPNQKKEDANDER